MLITHKVKKTKISKNVPDTMERNLSIFLIDRRGHYLSLPVNPKEQISNYCGWVHIVPKDREYSMYKIIDSMRIEKSPNEIINKFTDAERRSSGTIEKFMLAKNGLIYEVSSYTGPIHIDLDFRDLYDNDDRGRIYNIYRMEGTDTVIVEYTKYSDNDLSAVTYKKYLAISGIKNYSVPGSWVKRYYNYDASRNSNPEFYVFSGLRVECRKNISMAFSFDENRERAVQKLSEIEIEQSEKLNERYAENVLALKNNVGKEAGLLQAFAYTACVNALDGLSTSINLDNGHYSGLWAGLPWFHQYWARDELISAHSLLLEHRYNYTKNILSKYLSKLMDDGRLPNRYPMSELGNADGVGWLFKRLYDFLILCEQRDNFDTYFTLQDIHAIRERLEASINAILKHHSKDGLITNEKLETWMDTYFIGEAYDKDYRSGTRIEIQALFLSMLRLMNRLDTYLSNRFIKKDGALVETGDRKYHDMEIELREMVRGRFLTELNGIKVLNDGYDCEMHDVTRPNIFLSYYLYPDLLDPEEWASTFDHALPQLWCEWELDMKKSGGLSTIDKAHPLYQPHYTGQDNKSYHRGDTWFWINNIAAISMYRLDKRKYSGYIEKIINASAEDILFYGYIGYASELASSGYFRPGGCFCQTWSIATFIELIHEMYIE